MIKKIVFAGVGLAMICSPLLVSAQTTSTSSNASLIAVLTALVQQLEQEILQLIAAKSSTPTQQTTAPASPQPAASGMTTDVALACNAAAGLKRGDTDATTGGQVSQLQKMLGINPATGYFGAQTQTGFNNICGGLGNSQPTSVAGMSEYIGADFSFWYPSGWIVTKMSSANLPEWLSGVTPTDTFVVSDGSVSVQINVIVPVSKGVTMSGPKNDETFYFDSTTGEWTDSYDWDPSKGLGHYSKPVDVSSNTMGGLHIIAGDLVPLSASKFFLVTPGQAAGDDMVTTLINTLLATNPNVATPVSTPQQIATIQAEANAYWMNSPNSSVNFTASPTFGSAPLYVTFSANPVGSGASISFGDGTIEQTNNLSGNGTSNGAGYCGAGPDFFCSVPHTYTSAGTYTAMLKNYSGAVVGTQTITVTSSSASSLQTYTNSQYGFSLQYPANVSVQAPPSQQFVPGGTSLVAFGPVAANFAVIEPGWGTNGIVQISGNAYVNVTTKASDVGNCMTADTANATYTTIHGTQFLVAKSTDPAAGQEGYYHTYTALHNGACYSIDTQIMGVESGHMNAVDGATNDATTAQLQSELDTIAQSFHFTQ